MDSCGPATGRWNDKERPPTQHPESDVDPLLVGWMDTRMSRRRRQQRTRLAKREQQGSENSSKDEGE